MKTKSTLYEQFLDLLFPRFCVGCRSEGTWLCPSCREKIITIRSATCFQCHRLTPKGICPAHKSLVPLTILVAAGYYRDPILREAIHTFKYEGIRELSEPLSQLLIDRLATITLPANSLFVPVPLHPQREKSRGYNQSALLAHCLSQYFHLPIDTKILVRTKKTLPQVELKPQARLGNIQKAFVVKNPRRLSGKTVILVDDVATTGATLGECARVLRTIGVKRIWALVVAQG